MQSPLVYKTPIIESNEDTVGDTNRSLEEKVNLLNIEVIAMKFFIEEQMLILRQSRKDSTLQKSPCDHNSEIARLTEEIADLRNENRTKSCIIQTLLENYNKQQKPLATNKSDFIAPNKYVRSPKNNTIISASNRYQELSKNDDIENEGRPTKPTKAAESNKTGKRNNSNARKKSINPVIHRHKKNSTTCKEIRQRHCDFGRFNGQGLNKDLKGWELSNEKQKAVVKSFRREETSHMHLHAKPTTEKKPRKYYHSLWC